jgi:S-adenosylmethionine:diacylglycerol 3-amino-3-carboxypropyl transferase
MIKFAQVHEDPDIESVLIAQFINCNIMLVASGGSTGFYLINDNINSIDMVDINPDQIELCCNKLSLIKSNNLDQLVELESNGIYEQLFRELSTDSIKNVFSNENLIKWFGLDAVKYSTSVSFSEYFTYVIGELVKKYPYDNYWRNQLTWETPQIPIYWPNKTNIINHSDKLHFHVSSINTYLNNTKTQYDLISLSNITDWTDQKSIAELLINAHAKLSSQGYVLIRKLISDHDLIKIIKSTQLYRVVNLDLVDASLLYTQVIVLQKA